MWFFYRVDFFDENTYDEKSDSGFVQADTIHEAVDFVEMDYGKELIKVGIECTGLDDVKTLSLSDIVNHFRGDEYKDERYELMKLIVGAEDVRKDPF